MEITQSFRHSYSDGKTDRLEVELSIIYFSKHSCLPHSGISEILSFRLDCVHGIIVWCFLGESLAKEWVHIHFPHFVLSHIAGWYLYCPCFLEALVFCINLNGSLVKLATWFTKQNPSAPISVYISDSSCILNITISFLKFPSIVCDRMFGTDP